MAESEENMYKELFIAKAERTMESVNEAFLNMTGLTASDWGYATMEDIEKAEKEGFLKFEDGTLTVYADEH